MIYIENKKRHLNKLEAQYPNAIIVDVTSTAESLSLRKLSPFYPHGNIPVPYSDGFIATCVEAIWQGLKVFETADVDIELLSNDSMKNIKRTVRKYGKPLGHRKGIHGKELLNYIDARFEIYVPTYKWILENKIQNIITKLKKASEEKDIVLLDYNTNCNPFDTNKPLSHACLIKYYIEGNYPSINSPRDLYKTEQKAAKKKTSSRKNSSNSSPNLFS